MKSLFLLPFLGLLVAGLPLSEEGNYHGAQVFRVLPSTETHVRYLNGLMRSNHFDFWTVPRAVGAPVDIFATRWMLPSLKKTLSLAKIPFEIMIPDVESLILETRRQNQEAREKLPRVGEMEWSSYHDYNEIMDWVDSLAVTYPSLVTVEDVGTSYEGRTMKIVKVSTGGAGKPAIFTDAGIHAREWIAPATLTYIMNAILSNSASYQSVLDAVDIYFMPQINPDGYSYSWTDDRLWRKTRSPTDSGLGCIGVDPNRNWDFHWMESGASQNACTETYAGPVAFSEVETQVVRDQILKYAADSQVYLTFHSYSQVWLYPWGYAAVDCDDWQELADLANAACDALQAVHGTVFEVGGSGTLLYPAAGASDDYAKGVGGIKYSYTAELRDTGKYGFVLPPEQIIPSGEETLAAFEVVMNFVRDTYGKK